MRNNKGFTLVELLLVVLLGGFILVGILQVFNLNQNTSLLQKEMLDIQNSGFFAMTLLTNDLKKAGSSEEIISKFDVNPFDFENTSVDASGNYKLSINYLNFDNDFDCDGTSGLSTILNNYKVENNKLYCNDIEIVSGVERFSVMFGVDLNGDGFTDRYVNRDSALEIQNSSNKKITSVYFALLLKSSKELEADSEKKFKLLNNEEFEYNDGYFYRLFTKKVVLKNML